MTHLTFARRRTMSKRVRWTYAAELDYVVGDDKGKWVVGFLNDEGNPYECPTTSGRELVEGLHRIWESGTTKRIEVTVEIDEKLDKWGKQYPVLVDVHELNREEEPKKVDEA